jgi:hypothetical protein
MSRFLVYINKVHLQNIISKPKFGALSNNERALSLFPVHQTRNFIFRWDFKFLTLKLKSAKLPVRLAKLFPHHSKVRQNLV